MIFMIINREEIIVRLHINKTKHDKLNKILHCQSVDISGVTLNVIWSLLTKTTLAVLDNL